MSVQVRRRREAASFLATFVGAQGELLVDTTNNRVQVHDGTTPGGWPAAKVADLPSVGTFADVALNFFAGPAQVIPGGAFTRIKLPLVNRDAGGRWDKTNNWYTCPKTGLYQITATLRCADSTPAGTQYGCGVYTSEADGAWFLWNAVGSAPASRTTYPYARLSYQNAGDQLRMCTYSDQGYSVAGAGLQIVLLTQL